MKKISLTQGKFALVDDEDFPILDKVSWYFNSHGYADRKPRKKSLSMHRFLMGDPKGMKIDHINGDGLDNRKANLRICTHQQNLYNSKLSKKNKSGYKGVSWDKVNKKWRATVHVTTGSTTKIVQIGRFSNAKLAAQAYDLAARKHYGEFARLNFS